MESSSHITGDNGDEGCNSCESGWTMYLASPMHGDDVGGSGKGSSGSEGSSVDDGYGYIISDRIIRSRRGKKAYEDYADADDDDSLASDASTGPAKVKGPSSSLSEDGGKKGEDGGGHGKSGKEEDEGEEEDDVMRTTKFPATSRKKAVGKVDKGGEAAGNSSSRRGNSKKGSSSRRSFFLW
ncbi:hypothetical protein HU200_013164 [Digitaria exilis]|uniref:Uncharacterized protein n=1 Tax=Digitaria exilis TaxID=1010633 RepID=A0A835FDG0_9POAL|nr:hypothetical protein HU200_013164 [Digitaria exilis]